DHWCQWRSAERVGARLHHPGLPGQPPGARPAAVRHRPRRGVLLSPLHYGHQVPGHDLSGPMVITNEPDEVRSRRGLTYARQAPPFVSLGIGGADEIARWVLDRNGIAYYDELHAPYIATEVVTELTGQVGIGNSPVLVKTDTLLYRTDSIV